MVRKPKPELIFREEAFSSDSRGNHTRQTFDEERYVRWKALYQVHGSPWPDSEVRFYVGRIEWEEETK